MVGRSMQAFERFGGPLGMRRPGILLGQALYGRRDWDGAERAYRAAQELPG